MKISSFFQLTEFNFFSRGKDIIKNFTNIKTILNIFCGKRLHLEDQEPEADPGRKTF
jgi:hypothetical protein